MRSSKILEMINAGRIDELKTLLQDEIYSKEILKSNPGMKKRYAAMKKYFTYIDSMREACQKPCVIVFEDLVYTSFCNAYSIVLTTESCGELEIFDDPNLHTNVAKVIKYSGTEKKINFTNVIALAKSMGYKLKKSEFDTIKCQYLLHYDGAYFKLGLLDSSYGIINDGKEASVYHSDNGKRAPLIIKNDIGVCAVMPVVYNEPDGTKIIIDISKEGM